MPCFCVKNKQDVQYLNTSQELRYGICCDFENKQHCQSTCVVKASFSNAPLQVDSVHAALSVSGLDVLYRKPREIKTDC